MVLPDDKIDDVKAEGLKPIFESYVANLAGGMKPEEAEERFERGMQVWRAACLVLEAELSK